MTWPLTMRRLSPTSARTTSSFVPVTMTPWIAPTDSMISCWSSTQAAATSFGRTSGGIRIRVCDWMESLSFGNRPVATVKLA